MLVLIHRLAVRIGGCGEPEQALLGQLLVAARSSLASFAREHTLDAPANARLAFRELGLAIGLLGLERIQDHVVAGLPTQRVLAAVRDYAPVGRHIIDFWAEPNHRRSTSWTEHAHINDVMLATGLLPDGYFGT